jgi:hypothetical protein
MTQSKARPNGAANPEPLKEWDILVPVKLHQYWGQIVLFLVGGTSAKRLQQMKTAPNVMPISATISRTMKVFSTAILSKIRVSSCPFVVPKSLPTLLTHHRLLQPASAQP